jgi:hypothetical protein
MEKVTRERLHEMIRLQEAENKTHETPLGVDRLAVLLDLAYLRALQDQRRGLIEITHRVRRAGKIRRQG